MPRKGSWNSTITN